MTQETPAKVFSLLGAAMFSMFLLFGVSVSNASFNQTEVALPDVFSPSNVVAVLDNVASSYSNFVDENLIQPGQQSFAIAQYNLAYVIDEAGPSILAITGFDSQVNPSSSAPQVAGAFTQVSDHSVGGGFNIDSLYSLLIR